MFRFMLDGLTGPKQNASDLVEYHVRVFGKRDEFKRLNTFGCKLVASAAYSQAEFVCARRLC